MNKLSLIFAVTFYLFFALTGSLLLDEPTSDQQVNEVVEKQPKLRLSKVRQNRDYELIASNLCTAAKFRHGLDLKGFVSAVNKASAEFGLDDSLVFAVIAVESRCNPFAVSPKGAVGLMQLMPETAYWLGVKDPTSIDGNINGGAKYLRSLLDEFNWDVELALAAYNAGPGSVRKYKAIPPFRETINYVGRVLDYYNKIQAQEA